MTLPPSGGGAQGRTLACDGRASWAAPDPALHLGSLLSIPELKGIQWVYGDGKPDYCHWTHVYRKIREAGKLVQLYGGPEVLEHVADQLGSAEGIALIGTVDASRRAEVEALIARYC